MIGCTAPRVHGLGTTARTSILVSMGAIIPRADEAQEEAGYSATHHALAYSAWQRRSREDVADIRSSMRLASGGSSSDPEFFDIASAVENHQSGNTRSHAPHEKRV